VLGEPAKAEQQLATLEDICLIKRIRFDQTICSGTTNVR
jgi:hypothetical protein